MGQKPGSQGGERRRRRDMRGNDGEAVESESEKWRGETGLLAEKSPQLFAQKQRGPHNGDGEEDHGPHSQCRGEVWPIAQAHDQKVDGLGDGEMGGLLREDHGVTHLQHGKGKGQETTRKKMGRDQRQRDSPQGSLGCGT